MFNAIACVIAVWALMSGIYLIYLCVKKPKFGQGQTSKRLIEILHDYQIMKDALEDIAGTSYTDDFYNLADNAEIDEYIHLIVELKRDVARLQSKAHMALGRISEEVEH